MVTFKQSAIIRAPVEKVFACVANPKRIPEWRTDVPGISGISGETKTGTTFEEEVNFLGRKKLLMKVTDYTPGKRIIIQGLSGMAILPTQSFTFTPEGKGE